VDGTAFGVGPFGWMTIDARIVSALSRASASSESIRGNGGIAVRRADIRQVVALSWLARTNGRGLSKALESLVRGG
jgi:hypothetical protein